MRVLAVIPARLKSTRLKDKVLLDICGKPMIQHVYENVAPQVDKTLIVTDSVQVCAAATVFGADCELIMKHCNSGTDRVYQGFLKAKEMWGKFDFILNVQGDEPLIGRFQIKKLIKLFNPGNPFTIVTCAHLTDSVDDLNDRNNVFVTIDNRQGALYFSRLPIPYSGHGHWRKHIQYYKHIGIYGFSPNALEEYAYMAMSRLQKIENLEQLKWLENGRQIKCVVTDRPTVGVDTMKDLLKVRNIMDFGNEKDR